MLDKLRYRWATSRLGLAVGNRCLACLVCPYHGNTRPTHRSAWKEVAPPPPGSRPTGLPPRPDLQVAHLRSRDGLRSRMLQLESENHRLLANAAAALERIQVADRDQGGAVDEAETILSKVVRLDGTYVPPRPVPDQHKHDWRPYYDTPHAVHPDGMVCACGATRPWAT